ncbi:Tn3 family transposase [Escherichia coli]|uniref:Tn3 family transposase n=1 Tax=Escherichia coli TaxID=562 RepID=UPI003DA5FE84
MAELVNHQYRHAFAAHWGDGTTSSSDGQRFPRGWPGESTGHVNPKYGSEPGRLFYTHISDQYAPFSTRVVNVGVRDSTYVLSTACCTTSPDLRIEEHYTDTAGFTDHVLALMHLLGFRFAPRIRDLGENQAVRAAGRASLPDVAPADRRHPEHQARAPTGTTHPAPASSIKQGTVRLADAAQARQLPAPERTGRALRELGRIERTLFIPTGCKVLNCAAACMPGLNR